MCQHNQYGVKYCFLMSVQSDLKHRLERKDQGGQWESPERVGKCKKFRLNSQLVICSTGQESTGPKQSHIDTHKPPLMCHNFTCTVTQTFQSCYGFSGEALILNSPLQVWWSSLLILLSEVRKGSSCKGPFVVPVKGNL